MVPKDADPMTNSVDPYQTGAAVRSRSTLPRFVRPNALDHYRE